MVQSTLDLFNEVSMMDEVKNFTLGEEPVMLTRPWMIHNFGKMLKGETQVNILHKDLSVVKKETFVSGRTKDKIDFTALAFALLKVDEMDKIFKKESFWNF